MKEQARGPRKVKQIKTLTGEILCEASDMAKLFCDGFEGFERLYGEGNATRFFVAVSNWDWGHVLQVHDNIISNWKAGDTYIIPPDVFHTSANFGIAPKYTLTVTGVRQ